MIIGAVCKLGRLVRTWSVHWGQSTVIVRIEVYFCVIIGVLVLLRVYIIVIEPQDIPKPRQSKSMQIQRRPRKGWPLLQRRLVLQSVDPLQSNLGLHSVSVVGVDKDVADDTRTVDKQSGRDGHLKVVEAVALGEIDTDLLEEVLGRDLVKDNAELLGDFVVAVCKDGELDLVLLGRGQAVVGQLGSQSDKSNTPGLVLVKVTLQVLEGDVAVGAPLAAVEGDEKRAIGEQVVARHLLAGGIAQAERGEFVANLDSVLGLEELNKVLDGGSDGLKAGRALEGLGDGGKLLGLGRHFV